MVPRTPSRLVLAAWGAAVVLLAAGARTTPAAHSLFAAEHAPAVQEVPALEVAPALGATRSELRLLGGGPEPRATGALSLAALLLAGAHSALSSSPRKGRAIDSRAGHARRPGDPALLRAPPLPA